MEEPIISVLLVEDGAAHADAMRRSLAGQGGRYRIETAASPGEFRRKITGSAPDLIVFDLNLSNGKTFNALSAVLQDKSFPVLVMTERGDEAMAGQVLKAGALDYILKTDQTFSDMPHIVTRALREWRLLQEHQRIEDALQRSEAMYRSVVEDQSELICRYRADGRLSLVNEAYARYYGKSRDELINRNFIPHIPEPDLVKVKERIAGITWNNPLVEFEHRIITPAGEVRWQQWTHRGIYTPAGRLLEYQAVGRDITDRKRAEDALRQSELKFHTIYDFTSDAIMLLDRTRFIDCNKATLALFGCSTREEFCGKHPADLSPPTQPCGTNSLDLANRRIAEAFEKGSCRFDWLHRRVDTGASFPAEVLLNAMELDGRPVLQAIVHDITERMRAEAEKDEREARSRQVRKAESLGRMAGAIAHHFNNQMQVVMGNIELVMSDLPVESEAVGQLIGAMKAARKAARMSGLMLSYLGQIPVKLAPLDLSELCNESIPVLRAALPKDVVLEHDLPVPGPVIQANAKQVQQVLTSLVTNAWEACAEGRGLIRLSVRIVSAADIPPARRYYAGWQPAAGDHACLEVSDTGSGIASSDFEQIFDPFFSTKFTGRGLGLPVALGIVRTHGGGIVIKSSPGQGSVFQVYFPISNLGVPHASESMAPMPELKKGSTVLLVEDEEMVRTLAVSMLSHLGLVVLEAKDGAEAVKIFRRHQRAVNCVLCDLSMPHMDGWAVLEALRKITPDIPVVLASGYSEQQVMAGVHAEQPQAFLSKPYHFKELREAIVRALSAAQTPSPLN